MSADTRSKLLTHAEVKRIAVDVRGEQVWLRPPTVRQRGVIMRKAGFDGKDQASLDLALMQAWAVVLMAEDEAGAKIFQHSDVEILLDESAGGVLDILTTDAMSLINVKAADAGKS